MEKERKHQHISDVLPLALITGASSGIGAEFARQIAATKRYQLVLVARRTSRLHDLARELRNVCPETQIHVESCDLSVESERLALIRSVEELDSPIHLLVNNAGFGSLGPFSQGNWQWESAMIEVNISAVMHLCHAFLPAMLQQRRGSIINVCSTASFQALPYMATYAASKAFLLNFTLALSEEHRDSGVTFLAHCPGPTESEFHQVVGLSEKIAALPCMETATVVSQALSAHTRGKRILVNGRLNRLLSSLSCIFPRSLSLYFAARALRPYLHKTESRLDNSEQIR